MENQKKKSKAPIIICIACAVAVVAAIVVAILCLNKRIDDTVNEAYFVTNSRRIVDKEDVSEVSNMYFGATAIYQVYTIENDKVVKHEFFYEFKDEYAASKQFEAIKYSAGHNHEVHDVKKYGKYISMEYYEEEYMYASPDAIREEVRVKEECKKNNCNLIEEEDE